MTEIGNESAVSFRENNHLRKIKNLIQIDSDVKILFLPMKKNKKKKNDQNLPLVEAWMISPLIQSNLIKCLTQNYYIDKQDKRAS